MNIFRTIVTLVCCIATSLGNLSDRLEYYETLHHRDLTHRIHKRHVHTSTPNRREVELPLFGRKFHLYLRSRLGVLAADFRAYSVKADGKERSFGIDPDAFYNGFIDGESHSEVEAYWEDDNLHAVISTPSDTYYIEPSWRHLPKSNNYTMLAYKASDIKKTWDKNHANHTKEKVCGFVRPEEVGLGPIYETYDNQSEPTSHERKKRQSGTTKTVCPLLLVADYKFYKEMGLGSLAKTSNYLISLINRVNSYYHTTEFDATFNKNMGFEIQELKIFEAATTLTLKCGSNCKASDYHFNMKKTDWDTRVLLESFSYDTAHSKYCLGHLFTYEKFSGGVLGLAYIGSPRRNTVGGVCTKAFYKQGKTLYLNTGWTTAQNRGGQRILTQEADLVTSHEFGHNWGSEHDPNPHDECSPSSFKGGKYLMYTFSVSGFEPNNKIFSPCSKRSISAVLQSKSSQCFREPRHGFCGNYQKELNEQCDAGIRGQNDNDECCFKNCTLKRGKQCSDYNSPCCKNCMFASSTEICKKQPTGTLSCEGDWKCQGGSAECVSPKNKTSTDGNTCVDEGKCKNGGCMPFCESKGKKSCLCETASDSCYFCCQENSTSPCITTGKQAPNYRPCYTGYCKDTVCQKQVQDFTERFWNIIENIDIDFVVEFMKDNIVGTIIVFSMIIWIPASCVISHIDKKRLKEDEEAERSTMHGFTRPENEHRIKASQVIHKRPMHPDTRRGELMTVM